MRTRVLRRAILFLRVRCSILILLIKTLRCSIRSLQNTPMYQAPPYKIQSPGRPGARNLCTPGLGFYKKTGEFLQQLSNRQLLKYNFVPWSQVQEARQNYHATCYTHVNERNNSRWYKEQDGKDLIELAQERDNLRAVVYVVLNLTVPQNAGRFLTG